MNSPCGYVDTFALELLCLELSDEAVGKVRWRCTVGVAGDEIFLLQPLVEPGQVTITVKCIGQQVSEGEKNSFSTDQFFYITQWNFTLMPQQNYNHSSNKRPRGLDALLGHLLVKRTPVTFQLAVQRSLNI